MIFLENILCPYTFGQMGGHLLFTRLPSLTRILNAQFFACFPFWVKKCFSSHFALTAIKGQPTDALLIVLLPIMGPEKGTDKLAFCTTSLLIATKIHFRS